MLELSIVFEFVTKELGKTITLLEGKFSNWIADGVLILPNIFLALIVFTITYYLAKYITKGAQIAFSRSIQNRALANFLSVSIKIGINLLGLIVAINILNLDKAVTSILAGIGILGFALGFALQDMTANLVSGIALVVKDDYPFKVGDFIGTGAIEGEVMNIDLRSTSLKTISGQHVIVPNKQIYENSITNYSSLKMRRVDLNVGISYGEDLERVQQVTMEALKEIPFKVKNEPIQFYWEEFGDSSINFRLIVWVKFNNNMEHYKAKHYMVTEIKKAYAGTEITIPFPIRTLDFGIKGGVQLHEELAKPAS